MSRSPLSTRHDCTVHGAASMDDARIECDVIAAGHELSLMQRRIAAATPSRWRDAVVVGTDAEGWIELALFADGRTVRVWNHRTAESAFTPGEPVVLHGLYTVLARGAEWLNVLIEVDPV